MTIQTSFSDAQDHLSSLFDRVVDSRETVIVTREPGERVALIAADELESLEETAYLLRSPRNAQRLLEALQDSVTGQRMEPLDLAQLRAELGAEHPADPRS